MKGPLNSTASTAKHANTDDRVVALVCALAGVAARGSVSISEGSAESELWASKAHTSGRRVASDLLILPPSGRPSISVELQRPARHLGPVTVKGVLEVQGLSRNAVYDMLVDHANSHRVFRNVKAVRLTDQGRGVRHMHQVPNPTRSGLLQRTRSDRRTLRLSTRVVRVVFAEPAVESARAVRCVVCRERRDHHHRSQALLSLRIAWTVWLMLSGGLWHMA
jgi:hypothetical protein